ncbi:MAG: tRNA (adenosine(37)-N6)-threonylcarbamoyltransferase complex transferase subunit TsaD [Spirochaetaceae bacterium]|jgi:N6-L-threonylcarbamoyladenine synthase|nr:tRNA (adenosine(37)-N6)-threonylcarbamoyltransferase complex transferase subunit TsaD [Spirochaetaceae bacterium]
MKVLGIETSCDECAAAVVENGVVLSNVVATQIPFHAKYQGVVPEIASRMHTRWIYGVVDRALKDAGLKPHDVEGLAVTAHPGLLGSLLVGLHFGKAFAWARDIPYIAVDHLLAHLYASRLRRAGAEEEGVYPDYPFLGLLVSGGHSAICRADDFDDITVLGTTIDDAVGEAFDKVAKFYGLGYPGGAAIDRLAQTGDSGAFKFPMPNLYKKGRDGKDHPYDFSYSGLKTAVVNQLEQFRVKKPEIPGGGRRQGEPLRGGAVSPALSGGEAADIAASFQKTAVEILLRGLFRAAADTGITTVVAGGGVAANSYLRSRLAGQGGLRTIFPPPELCGDNGAMVAGIGERYLLRGDRSALSETASARVRAFRRSYP